MNATRGKIDSSSGLSLAGQREVSVTFCKILAECSRNLSMGISPDQCLPQARKKSSSKPREDTTIGSPKSRTRKKNTPCSLPALLGNPLSQRIYKQDIDRSRATFCCRSMKAWGLKNRWKIARRAGNALFLKSESGAYNLWDAVSNWMWRKSV